ncbi:MAG: hypothetical protein AAF545_10630 [Pseudomonadota bacterium]
MTDPDRQRTEIDVILVHGTWARNAAWTQSDGLLSRALSESSEATIRTSGLPWSGRNWEKDRWAATESLSERLRSSDADLKAVIGHSHGGNVGAAAMHQSHHGDDDAGDRALITLNTPFIVPVRRSTEVSLIFVVLLVIAVSTWVNSGIDQHLGLAARAFSPVIALLIVGLIAALALWGVPGAYTLMRRRPAETPWLKRLIARPESDRETRVLCIATADDEALGWLQVTEVLLNLPFLLLHRFALPLVLIAMSAAHFFFEWDFTRNALADFVHIGRLMKTGDVPWLQAGASFWIRPPLSDDIDAEMVSQLSQGIWEQGGSALVTWLSLVSVVGRFIQFWSVLAVAGLLGNFLLSAVAFGTGLGYRSLIISFFVRMRVSAVPVGFSNVEFVEIDPAKSGWLRHSNAYNDEKVAATIEHWLTNSVLEQGPDDIRA